MPSNQFLPQPTLHVIDSSCPFRSDILSKPFFSHPLFGSRYPDPLVGELISGQPNDRQLAFARIPNSSTSIVPSASSCPSPSVDLIRPRPRQALLERATRTRTRPLPESASLHFRQPTWLSAAASLPVRLQGPLGNFRACVKRLRPFQRFESSAGEACELYALTTSRSSVARRF